jgi:hypothetical protein
MDIHFVHVKSSRERATIMTHGWPGPIVAFMVVIGRSPTRLLSADVEDVLISSCRRCRYGFSEMPAAGWERIAGGHAHGVPGYARYVAQGGDWGSVVCEPWVGTHPLDCSASTSISPATLPLEIARFASANPPEDHRQRTRAFDLLLAGRKTGVTEYFSMLAARPQAMGYGQTDSPAGLAAFLLVHPGFDRWTFGADAEQSPTRDAVLDDFTLYWLTNSATSAARIYWENGSTPVILAVGQRTGEISVPVAITVFPEDVYTSPETWARRAFKNLYYFNEGPGGHFARGNSPSCPARRCRRSTPLRNCFDKATRRRRAASTQVVVHRTTG